MLQAMKSKAATWVVRVLAVLLIISFAAWGIEDMLRAPGLSTDVAEVGGTKITANEFGAAFRRQVEMLSGTLGRELDSEQARDLGVAETTLDGLISQRLLDLYAEESGIIVGDDQVVLRLRAEPAFHGPGGGFDRAMFHSALSRLGITEQRYVEDLRQEIQLSHLTGVLRSASVAPDPLVRSLYHYRNDKRVARFVEIPRPSESTLSLPGDSTLTDFHKENAAAFTAPERRDLTALHLDPKDVAAEIEPSEGELRDEYENRLQQLVIPERRNIGQIVVGDEAAARRALEALRSGRAIADVAKAVAGMDEDAVSLGLLAREDLPQEIADAAFALQANIPSEPVRSPVGWHILLVDRIEPGRTPSFAETRAKIREDLAREQAVDTVVKLANQVEDALAGGAALEEAASQVNAKLLRFRSVERSGRSADGDPEDGLLVLRRFLKSAFETNAAEVSDLIDTALGGYFIVRVDRVVPPALEPFDKVRKEVAAAWRRDRLNAAAKRKAEKLLGEVKSGRGFDTAARELKLTVKTSSPFTRFDQSGDVPLPSSLAAELFRAKQGQAALGATGAGYAVAVMHRVEPANVLSDKDAFDEMRGEVAAAMGADLLSQYTAALREVYPVSVNAGALERLFDEGAIRR